MVMTYLSLLQYAVVSLDMVTHVAYGAAHVQHVLADVSHHRDGLRTATSQQHGT